MFRGRIVYENNRQEAIDTILNNQVPAKHYPVPFSYLTTTGFAVCILPKKVQRSSTFMKKFPFKTTWVGFEGRGKATAVAIVEAQKGKLVAFRNGWDASRYNFLIYYDKEFHFRQNIEDTINLVRILTDPKNLPLHIKDRCKANVKIVLDQLKCSMTDA